MQGRIGASMRGNPALWRGFVVPMGQAKRAGDKTLFLVLLGLKTWMEKPDIANLVELYWWPHRDVGGVDFRLTPVQHWSAHGVGDRSETLWGGWAVLSADSHWYFGGDTAYSKDFVDCACTSPRARRRSWVVALTSRCYRLAHTRRAGSCASNTRSRKRRCRFNWTWAPSEALACIGARSA